MYRWWYYKICVRLKRMMVNVRTIIREWFYHVITFRLDLAYTLPLLFKLVPTVCVLSPSGQATDFIKRNIVLSSGFVGGFFLGLAS